jgi:YVTN family beta-propeller protein
MPRSSDIPLFSCQFSANHDRIESSGRGALRCSFALHIALIATVLLLLSGVSASAQTVTATLPAGLDPTAMAVNPVTNKIYVANFGTTAGSADGSVTVIDGATNSTATLAADSANPSAIAVNPLTNNIYVANSGNNTVSVISGATGQTSAVSVGGYPNALAVNSVTNKIYVANRGSGSLTVIDGATNATITVAVGTSPALVAVNPFTNKVYIANTGSNNLTILDGATNTTATLSLGSTPAAIGVNAVTNKVYVATMGNPVSSSGGLTIVDGITSAVSTVNVGVAPRSIAINPITNEIYVANSGSSDLTVIDGGTLSTTTVPVGNTPLGVGVNTATNSIYLTNSVDGTVTVVDGLTSSTITLTVGSGPSSIAVNPITNRVYSGNSAPGSNSVTVIDGAANKFTAVSVGNGPSGELLVDPLTDKVFFGIQTGVAVLDGNSLNSGVFPSSTNAGSFWVNPATSKFYISDSQKLALTVYDEPAFTSNTFPLDLVPGLVLVNAVTNRAYSLGITATSNTMTVLDLATFNTATIPMGFGQLPVGLAINPVTNKVYIANINSDTVTEIDGSTNSVATIPVGPGPTGIAVNPLTNKVYVTNQSLYEITVIDGATHQTQQIAVAGRSPLVLAVNPLTNKVYVAEIDGVAIIDGATNQSIAFVKTPAPPVGYSAIAIDLALNKIYLPFYGTYPQSFHDSSLIVIDGDTNTATRTSVGQGSYSVAVNPVTNEVFVANDLDGTISVIDDRSKLSSPIVTEIAPLEKNTTSSATPQFTISASDSTHGAKITNVYYQMDTRQGAWLSATNQGNNSFTATPVALLPGFHTLYAFASDGQEATSGAPLISNIAAYYFLVVPAVPPPANDFTGSFDTFNQRIAPGQQAVYNLTLTPINSFTGDVTLTASNLPPGATLAFSPSTITGGSGSTAITVVTTSATPLGSYDITLTAASGLLVHSTAITLNVGADGDFIGSFDHSAVTVFPGGSTNLTLTLKPLQGFNANVSFSVLGLPSGASATFSPTTIIGGSGQTILTIATTAATPKGGYPVTVVASTPGLTHTTIINLLVGAPDFAATITPTFQAVSVGGSAQYVISVHTIGTVPFGQCLQPLVTGLPVGVTASLNPPSIDPDKNGTAVLTLQTRDYTPQGGYYPFVSITGGGQSHSAYISLAVSAPPTTGDFSGSFSNISATAAPNSPATYVLNLTSSGGFDGNVALAVSGLPDDATGSFSPSILAGGSGTSTLTVAVDTGTPPGVYNFAVTASSGSTVIRTTTLTLLVGVSDFTGTITPSTRTIAAGASTQYTVTLNALGSTFFGLVNLYVANLPPGVTASFSTNPVVAFIGFNSVLTLTSTSATPPGTYSLLVTAIGGGESHARVVPLTVVPSLGSVSETGSMSVARLQPTATLLTSGKVLIAGGVVTPQGYPQQQFASTELYDPATGTFSSSGNMNFARSGHTATLLNNGKVLLTGGWDNSFPQPVIQSSAELYDPSTGTFTLTGSMNTARVYHTATLLPDGTVLIAGGDGNGTYFFSPLASAEIYDPITQTFTTTGTMSTVRMYCSATLLNNGKVLIAGGENAFYNSIPEAELYDPSSRTFTVTGSLNGARQSQTATLLNNGKVLFVGGTSTTGTSSTNELYDPSMGTFSATGSMTFARSAQGATELNNGTVFVAGGQSDDTGNFLAGGELFDPQTGNFTNAVSLSTARYYHTQSLLNNGSVLIAGGPTTSAELFKPVTFAPAGLVSISITPATPVLAAGSSQRLTVTPATLAQPMPRPAVPQPSRRALARFVAQRS